MLGEEMQAKLYQKMSAEQEQYRKWLLGQPPGQMLTHALEYVIRQAIVEEAKEGELPMTQIGPLLKVHKPLAVVFQQWQNHQIGYLEGIRDAYERSADAISYQQQQRKTQREGR